MTPELDIRLGMPVRTMDGAHIGKVDRLVLDPDTRELLEIIIHQGHILTRDRIVERAYIDNTDEDGTVYLRIASFDADELPVFTAHEQIIVASADAGSMPMPGGGGTSMDMPILWRAGSGGHGTRHVSTRHYTAAVADSAGIEVRSSLPENGVAVGRGTVVIDVQEKKIGTVVELFSDKDGGIIELVVQSGFMLHHDLSVPAVWIDVITHRYIKLNVTAEQVVEMNAQAEHDWAARNAALVIG